jgi:hypothetical protein
MASINDIFEAVIQPLNGDYSRQLAQYVIGLNFTEAQHARYQDLASRNQDGSLTEEELAELDAFITANAFLTIIQSKARRSLMQHSPAA